ncbi:MAG: riboflavin synthase [Gammaproteobacteria bacterium]|nr:riboflavin synthase [Gammaproteobacteria bacterium]
MFTGIIEAIGNVTCATRQGGDLRLVVNAPELADQNIALGDSVAVNGLCLTVVSRSGSELAFDVSKESIDHSLIGQWSGGSRVNLELAMLPTTRFGGHIVSGHVDGLAELIELREDARSWRMHFRAPAELARYLAKKGSVTLNGVSLTVNNVDKNVFDINVIPHTFKVTTLGELGLGDQVHLEVDLVARYLERLLKGEVADGQAGDSVINQSFLAEHGFA